jgi:hypothetical protein
MADLYALYRLALEGALSLRKIVAPIGFRASRAPVIPVELATCEF